MTARGGTQRIPRPPDAAPGGRGPWERLPRDWQRGVNLRRLRLAFRAGDTAEAGHLEGPGWAGGPLTGGARAPAAVLVVAFEESGEAEVVLTRRSSLLRTHTDEISFPGGRLEPSETPAAAALREAKEEVGLDPAGVEVLGSLAPLSTLSSGTALVPVVGVIDRRPALSPNPAEVARAFTVRLAELMSPSVYHQERWGRGEASRAVHFFELPGETVWGATAKILVELLGRVAVVPPEGADHR